MYTLKLFNNGLGTNPFWDSWDKAFFEEDWGRWRENIVPHKEHKDHYEYWINLAGFKKENVEAVIHKGVVVVKAEKDGSTSDHSFYLNGKGPLLENARQSQNLFSQMISLLLLEDHLKDLMHSKLEQP